MKSRDGKDGEINLNGPKTYTFRLGAGDAMRLEDVARHMGAPPAALARHAVAQWVDDAIAAWGDAEAAKIVQERAEAKWRAECADPRGAVQWAKKRYSLGRRIR